MKHKIYSVKKLLPEGNTFYKRPTTETAEITIGTNKFKIVGPKDTLELQKVIKSQSAKISSLEYELNSLKRNQRSLLTELQELKNTVQTLKRYVIGDD